MERYRTFKKKNMLSLYLEFRKVAKNKLIWLAALLFLLISVLVLWNFHRTMYDIYPLAVIKRTIKPSFSAFYPAYLVRLNLLLCLILSAVLQVIEHTTEIKTHRTLWVSQSQKRRNTGKRNGVFFVLGLLFSVLFVLLTLSFSYYHSLHTFFLFNPLPFICLCTLSYGVAYSGQLVVANLGFFRQFWMAGLINLGLYFAQLHPISWIQADDFITLNYPKLGILLFCSLVFYGIYLLKLAK